MARSLLTLRQIYGNADLVQLTDTQLTMIEEAAAPLPTEYERYSFKLGVEARLRLTHVSNPSDVLVQRCIVSAMMP